MSGGRAGKSEEGVAVSITKDLWEWLEENDCRLYDSMTADLRRIADRVDAAHEEDVRKAYDVGFASADDWYADKTDDDLAEHGLVRLPVDADGKTWHVGDKFDHAGSTFTVVSLAFGRPNGWTLRVGNVVVPASHVRHHEPTPAERIRAWVDSARDDRADLRDLLAIADELEADYE